MKKSIKFLLFVVVLVPTVLFVVDELVRYGVISTYTRSIIWLVMSAPLWLPVVFISVKEAVFDNRQNESDPFVDPLNPLYAFYNDEKHDN